MGGGGEGGGGGGEGRVEIKRGVLLLSGEALERKKRKRERK